MQKKHKTIAFAAQMQKTLPLVIHNAVKDNFTRADMKRNAGNAENDTLCYTNAENPSPSHTEHYQRNFAWAWMSRNATPCCTNAENPPLLIQNAIKDNFTWAELNRNT